MLASTQIGGKYHKDDNSLFRLKKILQSARVVVSHPIADQILYSNKGQGFAFDPTKTSFYEVETDYYNSIATSDFHTVNNTFLSYRGYIGESAALEMAYAMSHHKPIIVMYPLRLKDSLDTALENLLLSRENCIKVHDMHELSLDAVKDVCLAAYGRTIDYGLTADEEDFIADRVKRLFAEIEKKA